MSGRTLLSGLLALATIAFADPARAATYYLGKTACRDAGGGSKATPFCSFAKASATLKAGDVLKIGAGTYATRWLLKVSGAAGKPIVIEADGAAKPVLDGKALKLSQQGMLQLDRVSHVTVRGLTVRQSSYHCVMVIAATAIKLEKLLVDGCMHGGVVFEGGGSNNSVSDSEIRNTDRCAKLCTAPGEETIHHVDGGISISGGLDFTIARNRVHDGNKDGIDIKDASQGGAIYQNTVEKMGEQGIRLNHAVGVKVYRNQVRDSGRHGLALSVGYLAKGVAQTTNNEIYQNVVRDSGVDGISIESSEYYGQLDSNRIYNNVFYGAKESCIQGTYVGKNTIVNNIVANCKAGMSPDTDFANVVSHNLFFKAGATLGDNVVKGDPLFVNPLANDFHLKKGSPAIDKGVDMGLPAKGAPDIGAYEYGSTSPVHPPPREPFKPFSATGPSRADGGTCNLGNVDGEPQPLLVLLMGWLALRRRDAAWRRR